MSRPWMALTPRKGSDAQSSPGEFRRAPSVTRSNVALSSLEAIGKRSQDFLEKKMVAGFLDKSKDSQEVVNLIEQLRTAIAYYQVSGIGGIHVVRTGADAHKIVFTTAVDLQPDWGTGCRFSRRSCLRLRVETCLFLASLPLTRS